MDYSFVEVQITLFEVFVILIGDLILMTGSLPLGTTFTLDQILSLDSLINKRQCLEAVLKQNIAAL